MYYGIEFRIKIRNFGDIITEKMNILFIMTDQLRADHLGCMGNPILKTPNIDGIAENGVRFNRCYCANPMCMPNRASIFTSQYPSIHGVPCNGLNLNLKIPTFTQILKENGYYTKAIGKLHFQFFGKLYPGKEKSAESLTKWFFKRKIDFPIPYYGFEDVEIAIGHGDVVTGHYWDWLRERAPEYIKIIKNQPTLMRELYYKTPIPEELYSTTYVTEQSVGFLERYAQGVYGNKPFFLFCSYPDPHHPVCPPGKYEKMYKTEDIELPSNFYDENGTTKHEYLWTHMDNPSRTDMFYKKIDEEKTKKFIALTYGSIKMIDDGVGQILNTLERLRLSENTIIIFTSDHGDLMGDHGLVLKGPAHFHGVLNVPLLWKVPGLTKTSVSESIVNSIDIPQTILSLVGIDPLKNVQGFDITPILEKPSSKIRDCCLIEDDDFEHSGKGISTSLRTLITETHRLTIYRDNETIGDLFNLVEDKDEINNLWNRNKHRIVRDNLLKKLLHEIVKVQSSYNF